MVNQMDTNPRDINSQVRFQQQERSEAPSSKEISVPSGSITAAKFNQQLQSRPLPVVTGSVYSIRNIHKHHSILGLYFRFYRNLGRV
jgi:hypothetical protein